MNRSLNNRIICNPLMIYIVSGILFVSFNLLLSGNLRICLNLYLILFLQMYILILFGLDMIFSISFLTSISLIPSMLIYYRIVNENLGDLTLNIVPIHMYYYTFYVFIFIYILSLTSLIFRINVYEVNMININPLKLSNFSILVNNIIAITSSIIAFPSIPRITSKISESSFTALLPGHAWNQLVIVALIFNLPYLTKKKSVMITYLFSFIWFVLHGERADMVGLILGIIIVVHLSKNINRNIKIGSIVIGLIMVIFFISIKSGYNLFNSFNKIFTFTTISDTSYEVNTVISYIQNVGFTHGQIFVSNLESMIPFNHGLHSVIYFLYQEFPMPGGSSIISDPLMDWGLLGLIGITILYVTILKLIMHKSSYLLKYETLILICSIPRISWYGIYFVFTSMIFFIPLMYFLNRSLNSIFNK